MCPHFWRCSSDIVGHVLTVGTYGNGNVYIALD